MDIIKDSDDLYEYVEKYFKNDEDSKDNFCAIVDEKIKHRLKEVPLKRRLNWVIRSQFKDVTSDFFQFNLFLTFDKDELAMVVLDYHQNDKEALKNARFYIKMPREPMENLFMFNDSINQMKEEDLDALVEGYSISYPNNIYAFIEGTFRTINENLAFKLYNKLPSDDQRIRFDNDHCRKMNAFEVLIETIRGR